MRHLVLAACIAVCPAFAHADSIARQGDDWIRVSQRPCANETVVSIIQKHGASADSFRAASGHFQGKDFAACWAPAGDAAFVVYDDGDQGVVPMADLKEVPEA